MAEVGGLQDVLPHVDGEEAPGEGEEVFEDEDSAGIGRWFGMGEVRELAAAVGGEVRRLWFHWL